MSAENDRDAVVSYWERQELLKKQRAKWLQGLKEGSGVVVMNRGEPHAIATVDRVTATQLILSGVHARFRRDTGRQVGNPHGQQIMPVTAEARAKLKAKHNRGEFGSLTYRLDRLSDEEIAVMLDALNAYRASKEAAE